MSADSTLQEMRRLAAVATSMPMTNTTLAAGVALAELFEDLDAAMCRGRENDIPSDWKK